MIFEFERRVEAENWLEVGRADGAGRDPIGDALNKVAKERSDDLPAGDYRVRVPGHGWRPGILHSDHTFSFDSD